MSDIKKEFKKVRRETTDCKGCAGTTNHMLCEATLTCGIQNYWWVAKVRKYKIPDNEVSELVSSLTSLFKSYEGQESIRQEISELVTKRLEN